MTVGSGTVSIGGSVIHLNEAQRRAVLHDHGPLLVVAGAGSGKTRVLTMRIAHLVHERGVPPSAIMAVTFTNKAAREMEGRIRDLLGDRPRGIWISTFHAACVRILRANGRSAGIPPDFLIYDAADAAALIRDIEKECGISTELYPPKVIGYRISLLKNRMIRPNEMAARIEGFGLDQKVALVYGRYQDRLRSCEALDFDDLLSETVRLLESRTDVLAAYRDRFRHLLVDEYQDTNPAQYRLVRLLGDGERNICVVGDDDQSIYRFRGAEVANIFHFQRDYPDAVVLTLEENYRSTQAILNGAGAVVSRNQRRSPKNLWTRKGSGEAIYLVDAPDEMGEAVYIAERIKEGCLQEQRDYRQFAILYRTNVQSRILEERLRAAGIPYRVIGGIRFYDRKEIKDLLAYLRLCAQPRDEASFKRILNMPPRGIGPAVLARLETTGSRGETVWEALAAEAAGHRGLAAFLKLMDELRDLARSAAIADLVRVIIERTGYRDYIARVRDEEGEDRLEHIDEFVSAAQAFGAEHGEKGDVQAFLDHVTLVTDGDAAGPEGVVSLMTLHAAKGLEFPIVFMAGVEEGLLPHRQSLADPLDLEEERRLCYVGMTRAMERLYLTRARRRRFMGTERWNTPSPFLDAIPAEVAHPVVVRGDRERVPNALAKSRPEWAGGSVSAPRDGFRIGGRVRHPTFGVGTIRLREGSGEDLRITVHFAMSGVRKLSVKSTRLDPLE